MCVRERLVVGWQDELRPVFESEEMRAQHRVYSFFLCK